MGYLRLFRILLFVMKCWILIDNNRFDCRLNDIPEPLVSPDFSFSVENTIHKEIELIQKYL